MNGKRMAMRRFQTASNRHWEAKDDLEYAEKKLLQAQDAVTKARLAVDAVEPAVEVARHELGDMDEFEHMLLDQEVRKIDGLLRDHVRTENSIEHYISRETMAPLARNLLQGARERLDEIERALDELGVGADEILIVTTEMRLKQSEEAEQRRVEGIESQRKFDRGANQMLAPYEIVDAAKNVKDWWPTASQDAREVAVRYWRAERDGGSVRGRPGLSSLDKDDQRLIKNVRKAIKAVITYGDLNTPLGSETGAIVAWAEIQEKMA